MPEPRGKFIVIEGGDKSGKTTQIELLKKFLDSKKIDCFLTREPGGTNSAIAEKIRAIILDPRHQEMDARTELLLYLASRAQHVSEVIKPALEAGKIVICDRFDASTFAYQGAARQIESDIIKSINDWAKYGLAPDLTVYIDITPEQAAVRRRDEKHDRLDAETKEFHEVVRQSYLEQAEGNDKWFVVSAIGSLDDIAEKIQNKVDDIL